MAFGLLTTGLAIKTIEDLITELDDALRAAFGASMNVSTGVLGRIKAIFAERIAEVWELAEAVYQSQDPDAAFGAALDALCALTGTLRNPATRSVVTLTLTGVPTTTTVPGGSVTKTASTELQFETLEDATIDVLDAWAGTTAYAIGDRVTNDGCAYVCTDAGTSAGSGGPTGTDEAIADNDVVWRYMGDGTGAVDVEAAAVDSGAVVATSGDITEIVEPTVGWDGVINLEDAEEGEAQEADEDLRVRRAEEVAAPGTGTVPAITAALLEVDGVTAATVFYNNTDVENEDGVPPHTVECLVQGGDDADILQCLFDNVPAGIGTHGTDTGVVEDSQGTEHTFEFSRPVEIPIYVIITVVKDPDEYPSDGDDQIKAAIVAYGDAQRTGKNAVASSISAQAHEVAGVLEVSSCLIDDAPAPATSTTVQVTKRELAVHDTSRITVNSSDGEP